MKIKLSKMFFFDPLRPMIFVKAIEPDKALTVFLNQ